MTSGTIAIPTLTDAVLDGGETLVMTLTGASTTTGTVTANAAAAETTISDPGTVTVSLAADAVGGRGRRGHVHGGAVGGGVEPGDAALVDVGRHGGGRRRLHRGVRRRLHRGVGHVDVPRQLDGQADPLGDTLGDALAEGDETFAVTLTDSGLPAGVSLGTASATGTILDEDELSASVSISDAGMVTVSC